MARLTDNSGALLGGLEIPLSRLLSPLSGTQRSGGGTAITAPAGPPRTPEYGPGEIVFALHCAYGTFHHLIYSAAPQATAGSSRRSAHRPGCDALIEEPEERQFCPACGGYYCACHADPDAHECRSVRRSG